MKKLAEKGIDTVAFGLVEGTAYGIQIKRNLENLQTINTITLYMNQMRQQPFYDALLALRPERVIFNPGTENPEFRRLLEDNGVEAIEACTLVMLATGTY